HLELPQHLCRNGRLRSSLSTTAQIESAGIEASLASPAVHSLAWFAISVRPRRERSVARILQSKGYETFVPLYTVRTQARTTETPLFPGFVFCRFDVHRRLPILVTSGV